MVPFLGGWSRSDFKALSASPSLLAGVRSVRQSSVSTVIVFDAAPSSRTRDRPSALFVVTIRLTGLNIVFSSPTAFKLAPAARRNGFFVRGGSALEADLIAAFERQHFASVGRRGDRQAERLDD